MIDRVRSSLLSRFFRLYYLVVRTIIGNAISITDFKIDVKYFYIVIKADDSDNILRPWQRDNTSR